MLDEKGQANPTVSILIPYYNDKLFLRESIESVLRQTYKDFELVLINHACTDSSRNIARSFDDERIVHIDLPTNAGAGGGIILDAFLKAARGKYIKLFCADDILCENYLEKCLDYLEKNPKIDFCFTNEAYIDKNGKRLPSSFYEERTKHVVESDDWNFAALDDYFHLTSNLPFSSCFLKRDCFDNVQIDFTMVMMFDMSVFCQILLDGKNIGFLEEPLTLYRIHENQISSSANSNSVMSLSFFESNIFWKLFFETENVYYMRRLLGLNDESSLEDLRLELAKMSLNSPHVQLQIVAFEWLRAFFQKKRGRNEEGFTLAEFRKAYGHSQAAYCVMGLRRLVDLDGLGVVGIAKILLKQIARKFSGKFKKKLTHM